VLTGANFELLAESQSVNMALGRKTYKMVGWALGLLLVAGAGVKYFAGAAESAKEARSAPPVQTVTIARVEKRDFPLIVETTGTTVAANIVDIRPQVTNTVQKIHIKEGQMVRAGDLLFSLDDRADRANLAKAQATFDDAKRQYERAQDLLRQKFVSQASVDTALTAMESAQASLKSAEVTLSYDTMRSSIAGRAGIINVFPGALVQPGNTVSTTTTATATTAIGAMVTITQLDPISAQFTVPEAVLPTLFEVQRAGISPGVKLTAADGKPRQGKVYVVDNQVDPSIGAVRVKATLRNTDHALIPGQFVQIVVSVGRIKDALVVPAQAVIASARGSQLFVVDDQNAVTLTPVKVMSESQGFTVVTGVKAGDRIVVEGKQNLRTGGKVKEAVAATEVAAPSADNTGAAK